MSHALSLRPLLTATALLLSLSGALAQTRTQHTVQAGETLYHIARTHGLTVEQVTEANPGLSAQTLKAGSTIWLPTAQEGGKGAVRAAAPARDERVALLLPFTASGIEGGRSVEFRNGFRAATKRHNEQYGSASLCLSYDEQNGSESLVPLLRKMEADGITLIVGPVYPKHFQEVADFARKRRIRLVIPFYSRATQVGTNPYVYLANTPQKYEHEFAADLFLKTFKGDAVAFMHVGDRNAASFTAYLRRRLMANGQAVTEFSAEAPLEQMRAACPADKRTVVVPDASDAAGMVKALAKLEGFRKYYPDRKLQLLGYPDWLKAAPAYVERLSAADAYIFTDNFFNPFDEATRAFCEAYKKEHGRDLLDVTPRMALLGNDLAAHLLAGLATYGDAFGSQATTAQQLQSRIRFEQTEQGGGYVNSSLFFIHYKPTHAVEKIAPAQH